MKKHLLFFGSIVFLCLSGINNAGAQGVSFGYDTSGNRINRTIVMKAPEFTPPQDSTETVIEDEEGVIASLQDIESPQEIYTDVLMETHITIYPNPTRGMLTVKFSDLPQDAVSSITLFDMQGKIITQQQSLSDENRLDISAQPVGTYIMQITVGEEVTNWKIIKSEP